MRKFRNISLAVYFSLLFGFSCLYAQSSTGNKIVYAYYLEQPESDIRIAWIAERDAPDFVMHRRDGGRQNHRTNATRIIPMPGSDYFVFHAHITGMRSGASYSFTVGSDGERYRFRTMPNNLNNPVNFVTGGDMYVNREALRAVNLNAAAKEPYFAAIGGDWAYADGNPANVRRWFQLLEFWQREMTTPNGFIVPFIPAIGNHEVVGGYDGSPEDAPLYLAVFNLPGNRTYFTVDVADYLSIIALDSDHLTPIAGDQAKWLEEQLSTRMQRPHVFPLYHVPAWPSHRGFNQERIRRVRDNWVPVFERYGIKLAFENHDHTFKRTKPILNGEERESGVVYIGDGAWGVTIRETDNTRWYLEKAEGINHFWHITLHEDKRVAEAIDLNGRQIDRFEQEVVTGFVSLGPETFGVPDRIQLGNNYPNPFNPITRIPFVVPEGTRQENTRMDIYNLQGQRVVTLFNEELTPGMHMTVFDSRRYNLSSGMYIIRLQKGSEVRVRTMHLLK